MSDRTNDPCAAHRCPMCRADRETPDSECDRCGHDPTIAITVDDDRDIEPETLTPPGIVLYAIGLIGCALIPVAIVISLAWIVGVYS